MSADNNEAEEEETSRCASCGKSENDDIKLMKCTACYLVRYCGVKCQKDNWKKHKKECRRRAAELHDKLLFKQPESSHLGDCPICLIPLPLDDGHRGIMTTCCSKIICRGCDCANKRRELEGSLQQSCPFCRHPAPESIVEADRIHMKRVEANDPVALRDLGAKHDEKGDYTGAFEYWSKAADLGDIVAHYQLSCLHRNGEGVEKDEKKEVYHLEQAAIGGHPDARFNLGISEWNNRQYERAVKHFIIAATLGEHRSMANLKALYKDGLVSKEDFSSTLRAHEAAVDSTKSPLREAAEADEDYSYVIRR